MKKKTQNLLEQFRENQNQYFDDNGKAHASTYLRDEMTRMLQLINALEQECISMKKEIDIFQESVDDVVATNLHLKKELDCQVEQGNKYLAKTIEQRKEIESLNELAHEGLPKECIAGFDEVKFCHFRQGDGNKCVDCSHLK